jgi:hypothetical protein
MQARRLILDRPAFDFSSEQLAKMTFHPFRAAQAAAKVSFSSTASTPSAD